MFDDKCSLISMIMCHYFLDLTHFRGSAVAEILTKKVHFLEDLKTLKFPSEIN